MGLVLCTMLIYQLADIPDLYFDTFNQLSSSPCNKSWSPLNTAPTKPKPLICSVTMYIYIKHLFYALQSKGMFQKQKT